ncbi:2Fe-2S iron-sulfur cluster-binding protein [Pedobacter sp. SYSU D00535]|uniref:2Fe-2S iron-sulfur cluster-binding protein n=1 Tax=Pedobacter sp. SYSU D00535 TaxID=2810308 RepID=UPI001A95FAD5|nr:2Fe-2S iron-sulfur cluster-binding protein [Pedobacter sp. SYSU D00535]
MTENNVLQLKIVAVKQETALAKTYTLEPLTGLSPRHRPGQFLTFLLNIRGQEIRRSYSILSLPGEPLKITVKKVVNGQVSRYILDTWEMNSVVQALSPAGRFTPEPIPNAQRDIFCFAAGSGIIPILPQIRYLLEEEPQSVIHLIYSNHNEADTLFLDEIEDLAKRYQQLELVFLFSDPVLRLAEQGRLSNLSTEVLLDRLLRFDRNNSLFLLCGPFSYMRMLRFTIGLMGFKKENILKENYLPEIMRAGNVQLKRFPDALAHFSMNGTKTEVQVKSGQSLLDAGLAAGLNLPYSCKGGVCGNCAAVCRGGEVYMSINEVLTEAELKKGWVLTCTGFPAQSPVTINFQDVW